MALEQRQQAEAVYPAMEKSARRSPQDELARLADLHDEAAETAVLANIVGRAPYMACGLAALTLATVLSSGIGSAPKTIAWLIFVFAGIGAILRAYGHAMRSPFERATLKAFHEDMKAVCVYAGFGFGAGAFLTLPGITGMIGLAAFGVGSGIVVAAIIRDRALAIGFLAPVAVLSALAALLRPLEAGATGALSVLLAAAVTGVAILAASRMAGRSREIPQLAHLPLA